MKEMTNKKKTLIAVILAVVIAVIILVFALMGCQNKDAATPDEALATLTTETIAQQETTEAVTTVTDKVIAEQGLTVNENGEVIDNEGNKVEKNEDGTYTVKTEAGETVKVTAEEVKKAPVNNNTNAGTNSTPANNTKPTTKPNNNTSSTTSKTDNSSSDKPVNSNTNTNNNKPDTNTSSNTTTKTWHEAEYKYINHPAETITEKVWVVDKEAYTYEEPVYEKKYRTLCNDCGMDITDSSVRKEHLMYELKNGGKGSYHNEQVEIQTGTKTVEVPEEGHWETKTTVIKEAWTEKVLVREAGYY